MTVWLRYHQRGENDYSEDRSWQSAHSIASDFNAVNRVFGQRRDRCCYEQTLPGAMWFQCACACSFGPALAASSTGLYPPLDLK